MQTPLIRLSSQAVWRHCGRLTAFSSAKVGLVSTALADSSNITSSRTIQSGFSTSRWSGKEVKAVAEVEDEDDGYQPAQTWEGLEWVGTPEWKAERRALQREDSIDVFPSIPLSLEKAEIEHLVRSIVVEIFLLKESNSLGMITNIPFPRYSPALFRALSLKVDPNAGEEWVIEFDDDGVKQKIQNLMMATQTEAQSEEADEAVVDGDGTEDGQSLFWRGVPLGDPRIKFAIAQRFLKLTGHRVSDFDLLKPTVGELADRLVAQIHRNKKVAQLLMEDVEVSSLPNVAIHMKAVTLEDRETDIGRWKLIEEELKRKSLPLGMKPLQ